MPEDEILALRTLKCPLPALMAKKALARAVPGASLPVLADAPLAAVDIPHMCHHEGHAVEGVAEKEGYRAFRLRRGRPDDQTAPPAATGD